MDRVTLFGRTRRAIAAGPINILNEGFVEERPLLVQNPYITNEKQSSPPFRNNPFLTSS